MKQWIGLQEFVACVEYSSIAKAAERLGISKSCASKRISQLEEKLKCKLLYRSQNKLYPTRNGELVFAKSQKIFASLNELSDTLSHLHQDPEGEIAISMPLGLGESLIQPLIVAFQKKYPKVRFNLNFAIRRVNMAKEGYDMSFRLASKIDESIIAKKLLRRPFVLTASPDFCQHYGVPQHPEALKELPCLSYSEHNTQTPIDWPFKNKTHGEPININPNSRISADSIDALVKACLSGSGVLYCSEFFIGEHLKNGRLNLLLEDWVVGDNTLWLTYPCARSLCKRSSLDVIFTQAQVI